MVDHQSSSSSLDQKEASTMSYVFHLNSIIPQTEISDPLTLHKFQKFNANFRGVIPYKLGRMMRFEDHSEEYMSFIGLPVDLDRRTPTKSRNFLPTLNRTVKLTKSRFELSSRYNQYNHTRLFSKSPGVVRVYLNKTPSFQSHRRANSTDKPTYKLNFNRKTHVHKEQTYQIHERPTNIVAEPTVERYEGDLFEQSRQGFGTAWYENGDTYKGEWSENYRHGTGTHKYETSGLKYKGEWVFGKRHGEGKLTFKNGDTLSGVWEDSKVRESRATLASPSGQSYTGEIKNCIRHGHGVIEYPQDQGKYTGEWENDKRVGFGILESESFYFEGKFVKDSVDGIGLLAFRLAIKDPSAPNFVPDILPDFEIQQRVREKINLPNIDEAIITGKDIAYIPLKKSQIENCPSHIENGQFVAGKLEGAGMAIYGQFGTYTGNFVNGKRSGWGRMTYTDPNFVCLWAFETEGEYVGQWVDDRRQGFGVMTWPNNTKYEGYFKHDKRDQVRGTIWLMTGEIYNGGWVNNLMHGHGTLTASSGTVFKGQFNQGRADRFGELLFPDGRVFEGQVSMFEPHGNGKLKYINGDFYLGNFSRGNPNGHGKMIYKNGDVYEGSWAKGVRHGEGVMKNKDFVYDGNWKDNVKHGVGVLKDHKNRVVYEGNWTKDKKDPI